MEQKTYSTNLMSPSEQPTIHKDEPTPSESDSLGGPPPRRRFWQRFGGDGFLFSLVFHGILVLVAIFWVIQTLVITGKQPEDNTFNTGQGGGNSGDRARILDHRIKPKHASNLVSSPKKLSVGKSSGIALPEMPDMSMPSMFSGTTEGGDSKGSGGGSGGGQGTGHGIGIGGGKNFVSFNPFGAFAIQANTLEGTLYDLKKAVSGRERFDFNDKRKRIDEMKTLLLGLQKARFRKQYLDSRYFQAPQKLYATHIAIPPMNANTATRAFNCESVIQAPGWLAYYEGWISPPETAYYRFAGMGDDAMMVALDNKLVLWAFWPEQGRQTWFPPEKDWAPQSAYANNSSLDAAGQGGRYFGSWVYMEKGKTYKVQIAFAEATGGLFSAEVQIQKGISPNDKAVNNDVALSLFKLSPISDEEMKLKGTTQQRWTKDGPDFGCEINNVKSPRGIGTNNR